MAKAKVAVAAAPNGKVCPVRLEDFAANAKPLKITIDGKELLANVKAPFSTGSYGWNCSGRVVMDIGGTPVECTVGLNVTLNHSKPAAGGE